MRTYIIALLIASIILIAGCTTGNLPGNSTIKACTEEAKICPDGSAVGRNPAKNCEFDPCPIEFVTDAEQCEGGKTATCPDGTTYDVWNVVDGKCFQINYFRDPCGELPGRVMQITPEICQQAGGNWNECGSVCTGKGPDCIGIEVCNPQCECGGLAGFNCPAGYGCLTSGKIADELGVCVPKDNV